MNSFIPILINFIQSFIFSYLSISYPNEDTTKYKRIILLSTLTMIFFIEITIFNYLYIYEGFYSFIYSLTIITVHKLFFRINIFESIVFSIFFNVLISASNQIAILFTKIIFTTSLSNILLDSFLINITACFSIIIFAICSYFIIKAKNIYMNFVMDSIYLFFITSILLLSAITIAEKMLFYGSYDENKMILLIMCFLISTLILLYLIIKFKQNQLLIINKELLIRQYKNNQEWINELKNYNTKISTFRHDMKNHIAAIEIMLENNQTSLVEKQISHLKDKVNSLISIQYTKHEVLNYLIIAKVAKMEKQNIHYQILINQDNLDKIDENDFIVLLGNALDNAIENISSESKYIELNIKSRNNFIDILISNTVNGNVILENPMLNTTKQDTNSHGFGTKSMQSICKKYNGEINYTQEGNLFICHIRLLVT